MKFQGVIAATTPTASPPTGDDRVDLVSFTGSTATGRAIMAAASRTLKRVFLELGGKSAAIVLDDADLSSAVGAFSVAIHAGQGCALTTRLLVPRERYDEAVQVAADTMAMLPASDPTGRRRSLVAEHRLPARDLACLSGCARSGDDRRVPSPGAGAM